MGVKFVQVLQEPLASADQGLALSEETFSCFVRGVHVTASEHGWLLLEDTVVFWKILSANDVLFLDAAIGTGNTLLVGDLYFLQARLTEGVPAAKDSRHLVGFVILKETYRAFFLLHFG